jgi:hypothetical protein
MAQHSGAGGPRPGGVAAKAVTVGSRPPSGVERSGRVVRLARLIHAVRLLADLRLAPSAAVSACPGY